jgi:hypothetical protein
MIEYLNGDLITYYRYIRWGGVPVPVMGFLQCKKNFYENSTSYLMAQKLGIKRKIRKSPPPPKKTVASRIFKKKYLFIEIKHDEKKSD